MSDTGSTVSLVVGVITALSLAVTPIVVALISRKPQQQSADPGEDWVPRDQYDRLLDRVDQANDWNDRLVHELERCRDDLGYKGSGRAGPRRRTPR